MHYDLPGMGQIDGTSVKGAEIDFARQIAQSIGGPEVKIEFVEAPPPERDRLVQEGRVDLLVATFSILAERKQKVTLAGPYIVAHQDTLVRAEDSSITTAKDLAGKRLCKVEGSNSWKRVIDDEKIPAELVIAQSYPDCFVKLRANQLDAVSTDDVILAGFAAQEAFAYRFLNDPFTEEKYGVGIRKGDRKTCEAVNKAIGEMYQSGAAKSIFDKWFGNTNLKLSYASPPLENCN
ncbi:MAG: transporter substrate-binding domain-containing protein [Pseudonocardiaceae bacterium]